MTTYTVTTSNWNSVAFWSAISEAGPGHTLDFSALPSGYDVDFWPDGNQISIYFGATQFSIVDSAFPGTGDVTLGGSTLIEYFTDVRGGESSDYIEGSGNDDVLSGEGANDYVDGRAGNDSINGGSGADSLLGGSGSDTLDGGTGNDTLLGESGADFIIGGEGDDSINTGTGQDTAIGGAGNDYIDARSGTNSKYIDGGADNDTILGSAVADTLLGGLGNDSLDGGGDADLLMGDLAGIAFNETGTDGLGLASGINDFPTTELTYEITFSTEGPFPGAIPLGSYAVAGDDNEFLLDISGGEFSVVIASTSGGTGVSALPYLDGNIHTISVTWDSATGDLRLYADGAEIYSGTTNIGGALTQGGTFVLGQEQDLVGGGFNSAQIFPGTIYDVRLYDDVRSPAEITGSIHGPVADTSDPNLIANWVADPETGGFTDQTGSHNMVMSGDTALDWSVGNDTLRGGDGNDTLLGGDGSDRLYGGAGDDRLEGGAGIDRFYSDAGDDLIIGGSGRDVYYAADGFGNDTVDLGTEEIVINSGSLSEFVNFYNVTSAVTITYTGSGGTATDGTNTITFDNVDGWDGALMAGGSFDARLATFDVVYYDYGGATTAYGSAFNDFIVAYDADASDRYYDGGAGDDTLDTGGGNDTIVGGDGNDNIVARGGDDLIEGGIGNDTIYAGDGADTIAGGDGDDYIDGGAGDDFLTTGLGNDTLIGGAGNDTLMNSDGDDSLVGGAGDDLIIATGGNDTLEGGDGNDTLDGGADNDSLDGGAGDDSLDGGTGSDFIEGGSGSDTISGGGPGAPAYTDVANGNQSAVGTTGQDYFRWLAEPGSNATIFLDDNTGGDRTGDGAADFVLVDTTNNTGTLALRGFDYGLDKIVLQEPYTGISFTPIDQGGDQHSATATITYANGNTQTFNFEMNGVGPILADQIFTTTQPTIAGDDTLSGGDDADTFLVADNFGNDTIIGGEGGIDTDLIDLSSLTGPVTVSYTGDEAGTITDGNGNTIAFSQIERLILTDGDDSLDGDLDGAGMSIDARGGNDTIHAGNGADSISGGDGDDWLRGLNGNDTLIGGAGNDSINGENDNDSIEGGTGNDTIWGDAGSDTVAGGAGNDSLGGGTGNDSITGGTGSDTITGGIGDDVLDGGEGDDALDGGAGSDTLFGGLGRDTLAGGEGADFIQGNEDSDLADYSASDAAVTIVLDGTGAAGTASGGHAQGDTIIGIDDLLGSDFDDSLTGYDETHGGGISNMIDGGAGNDTIAGLGGDDSLIGGAGDDSIDGGTGNDTLIGGIGGDSLVGGDDNDVLYGGSASFEPTGTFASDFNNLATDAGITTSGGSIGTGNGGSPAQFQFTDESYIVADPDEGGPDIGDVDSINVSFGFDVGTAEAGPAGGISFSFGDPSSVSVDPGLGLTDGLTVQLSSETNEVVFSWNGTEIGREDYGGNIVSLSQSGASLAIDSSGLVMFTSTVTSGGPFTAQIPGTEWADTDTSNYAFVAGMNAGALNPNNRITNIQFDGTTHTVTDLTNSGNDTLVGGAGDDTMFGQDGDDSLVAGDGNDNISGGSGIDTIDAGTGDDTVDGGDGNDLVFGWTGNDSVFGGAGDDTIFGQDGNDTIYGGLGNDSLDGDDGAAGADLIFGEDGNDTIIGDAGNDTLSGGAGADSIFAGADDDSVTGDAGNDWISGEAGNDTVAGGTGDDTLLGGDGTDTFIYTAGDGNDTISDFNTGNTGTLSDGDITNNDSINLSAFYDDIWELHADQADDGILNQSNDGVDGADYANNASFGSGSLTFTGASADNSSFTSENTGVVCFASGTAIRTPLGEVMVETLRAGDLVTTQDHGPSKVLWIGCTEVTLQAGQVDPRRTPVRIKPDAATGARALLVSPQHCLLMTDATGQPVLVRARHLAEETRLAAFAMRRSRVTYWHVLLEQHSVLVSQGRPSESFYPGPNGLAMMAVPESNRLLKALPALRTAPVETAYGPRTLKVLTRSKVRSSVQTGPFSFASSSDLTILPASEHPGKFVA